MSLSAHTTWNALELETKAAGMATVTLPSSAIEEVRKKKKRIPITAATGTASACSNQWKENTTSVIIRLHHIAGSVTTYRCRRSTVRWCIVAAQFNCNHYIRVLLDITHSSYSLLLLLLCILFHSIYLHLFPS
jgi:hypothetical protein